MLILGVDAGTATTGFGILRLNEKEVVEIHHWGWIETPKDKSAAERLAMIYEKMLAILTEHQPDILAMERLFFYNNQKTAISVAQAQGVMYLAARQSNVPIIEYTPMQLKKVVTGSGNAKKKDVKKAVYKLLRLKAPKGKKTYFDDVADALGIALCHCHKLNGALPKVAAKRKS